jgi:hypothetical protein
MALPEPKPGLVIRYDYLWADDAAAGRDAGKDRPACLVAASDAIHDPRVVVILPITHSRPHDAIAVEIPPKVRAAIGLDDAPSWVIVSEYNLETWPNRLAAIPGRPGIFAYGFIPPNLFAKIKAKFLEVAKPRRVRR